MVTLLVVGSNYPLQPVAPQEKVLHSGCACSFSSLLCQFLFTSDPRVQEVGKERTEFLHSAFPTPQVLPSFFTVDSPYSSLPHYGPCPMLNLGPASLLAMAPVPP